MLRPRGIPLCLIVFLLFLINIWRLVLRLHKYDATASSTDGTGCEYPNKANLNHQLATSLCDISMTTIPIVTS